MKHACALAALLALAGAASAEVCNVKVATDASPDYYDLPSMVRSITSKWQTPEEKCWAMFYWNHIARRQTAPMVVHGMALTDPVRQANDYGYTMCSTIAGINCAIWDAMGMKCKYWDISLHTVPEVFYDGRWHMYDNSMSALYTLCDGKTIAGVEDIGKEGACEASGGKTELGHVARYHCLNATSPNGFLTGADCERSLADEARCFNPNGLKYRYYFYDWDAGHRYILNLRENEVYMRHYKSLGDGPEFYVPNEGKDPEKAGKFGQRANGIWTFKPSLKEGEWRKAVHSSENIAPAQGPQGGLAQQDPAKPGYVVYRVQSANVMTSQAVSMDVGIMKPGSDANLAVSTNNGLAWRNVWTAGGRMSVAKPQIDVTGAYEALLRVELLGGAHLERFEVTTTTMLNSKTQPRLNLGRNTVYVGTGEQTESIVFWPELQGDKYKDTIVDEKNVACDKQHIGYQGVVWPSVAKEDAYLVYRIDAPGDITRVVFGGRFYNRAPKGRIDLHWSVDGKTWTPAWSLTETKPPWDVIHYETAAVPKGNRAVWVKYLMNSPAAARDACSIYAVRMEANYAPADTTFRPIEVTFNWSERQKDRTLVERSHTQLVAKVPFRYTINVGGEDHPVVNFLRVNLQGAAADARQGYSDSKDAGGEKWVGRRETIGRNLAVGKPYTVSAPSETNWGAGDPDGKKLTDGVAGPPYAGGTSYRNGAPWGAGKNPVITVDLGETKPCASFGMNFHGYPWWDALMGEVQDTVEVLVSKDGKEFASAGLLATDLRWKDLPVNYMWPDHECIQGATFRLVPKSPVEARFVQYKVTNKRFFCCTELEVLDSIRSEPMDLRVALPDEK